MIVNNISYLSASEDVEHPKEINWSFDGVFGAFDRAAIQRGFKVYKEVCAACHSVNRISFRNFKEIGFSDKEIEALAAQYQIWDGPDAEGEMFERPCVASDNIPGPYKNDNAARSANNGALPPDLSLMIKARFNGANYIYSLLTGFIEPPKDFKLGDNMHYNPYFAAGGRQLAMTPPLIQNGQVEYDDDIEPTIDQMAKDVVHFLQWAAEPEMEDRKSMGIGTLIFVLIVTVLFFFANKRAWRNLK